jgi:23S rRNA pseudouridine1911/1915/1917 synthase
VEARLTKPIPPALAGERADKIVAELAGVSRQVARGMFAAGVAVDGRPVSPKDRIGAGVIEFPSPPAPAGLVAEEVPFTVAYENDHLLIVDKPPGVVVHPGAGTPTGTLAAGLINRFPELAGVGEPGRAGLVHRLDRGTSGLLAVARTPEAYHQLTAALRRREIHRSYLALVHGVPAMPTGTIDAPIGRDPAHPTRQRVTADGRPARTHYHLLAEYRVAALLTVRLESGRTHQIRVHLAAIDHPIVGDHAYTRRSDPVPTPRIFLHAHRLRLAHPATGEELDLESPLPHDLQQVINELARRYPGPTS